MRKIVLVGMCPSGPDDDGRDPLTGGSARRLAAIAGLRWPTEYLLRTERMNLVEVWPGDCWPTWYARKRAGEIESRWSGVTALLLERAVADAFGLSKAKYLSWCTAVNGGRLAVVPHPSGRNRWYNDAANVVAAQEFLMGVFLRGR